MSRHSNPSPSLPPDACQTHVGVTLVELLVTISLMVMVGAATVAALSGGLRVWQRALVFGTRQQFVLIAVDRLQRDFHNVRRFALVPFDGAYDHCAFASVEYSVTDASPLPELGRLGYFLDEHRRLLCRSFVPYRLARAHRLTERCQPILEDVTRLRFSYFGAVTEQKPPEWSQHWDTPTPPLAVKVDVTVQPSREPAATHTSVILLNGAVPAQAASPEGSAHAQ